MFPSEKKFRFLSPSINAAIAFATMLYTFLPFLLVYTGCNCLTPFAIIYIFLSTSGVTFTELFVKVWFHKYLSSKKLVETLCQLYIITYYKDKTPIPWWTALMYCNIISILECNILIALLWTCMYSETEIVTKNKQCIKFVQSQLESCNKTRERKFHVTAHTNYLFILK